MGYTTTFDGQVEIVPPLNEAEISFLTDLASTRRMLRTKGPLFITDVANMGQGQAEDVVEYNRANGETSWDGKASDSSLFEENGQPGLWLQWVPTEDGTALEWDGNEKFYNATEWMRYLIDNLLAPSAKDYLDQHANEDPRLGAFTCNHVVNGEIYAEGEESGDLWVLVVQDNQVAVADGTVTYNREGLFK